MHSEQKVCEQEVIIGVSKKSLHTGHRSAASTGARLESGVSSQSVESGTSKALCVAMPGSQADWIEV